MLNKVFLIGNLTRDPELTETPSGVSVCKFSIAVQRAYSQGDGEKQTDFFNCTAWRGLGETIAQYTKKGNKLAVVGSIQLRDYTDNQNVKRTAVEIIVNDVEFLTPKAYEETGQNQTRTQSSTNPTAGRRTSGNKPVLTPMDGDDDIPF